MNEQYPMIRRWGKLLHSMDYYIDNQIEQAKKDKAPMNAIHKREDGSWATTDDITSEVTRQLMGI